MVESSVDVAFPLFKAVTPDRRMRMPGPERPEPPTGRMSPRSGRLSPASTAQATAQASRTSERRMSHE